MLTALLTYLLTASPMTAAASAAPVYDPLQVPPGQIKTLLLDVEDTERGSTIPIKVYLPSEVKPAPVVIFSHGLGGSRHNNPYLGNHWAARGYVAVYVQHRGSDEGVWREAGPADRLTALQRAASGENFARRVKDIPAVLNALEQWNQDSQSTFHQRLDMQCVGMSGHSFGAVTTQAMAGAAALPRASFREPRIKAAVMMSPSPLRGDASGSGFAAVTIPCLLMTGTEDDSPVSNTSPADRLKVFPALTNTAAWQVVFNGAKHSAFTQRRRTTASEDQHHRAILALTTAFWDAQLKKDPSAKAWLNGDGARKALAQSDQWQVNDMARADAR